MILGLIFGPAASFFRPLQEYIDASIGIGVAIQLEMQLRNMPEAQACRQLVTQIMPGVIQGGQGLFLAAFVARQTHLDMGVPAVRADVGLGNRDLEKAGVIQLETDEFGEFLLNGYRDPLRASFIHGLALSCQLAPTGPG